MAIAVLLLLFGVTNAYHALDSSNTWDECTQETVEGDPFSLIQSQLKIKETLSPPVYFWPSGMGLSEHYSVSENEAPRDLSGGPSWNWTDPRGRYFASPSGVNIDAEKNIYLVSQDGIYKFTAEGELLWSFVPPEREIEHMEVIADAASLYKGTLYFSTTAGRLYAISMQTGKQVWMIKPCEAGQGNNGFVNVGEDTVIFGSCSEFDASLFPEFYATSNKLALGVNATDGEVLWTYRPDTSVWNFVASFGGDGTFIFQDISGRVYRNRVSNGTNIWKNGGEVPITWTDGVATLGQNRLVYAVSNIGASNGADNPGRLVAYRLGDGAVQWEARVPRPPNGIPAVGKLVGHSGLSVVLGIGQQCGQGNPTDVYAFNADNGKLQWIFNGPAQSGERQAGNSETAMAVRLSRGMWPNNAPNPWSAPTIDAKGIVFIGNQEGGFYALADANGDGGVKGDGEVSMYDTGSCFALGAAPAIAPGMIVAASIDAMYVFKSDALS